MIKIKINHNTSYEYIYCSIYAHGNKVDTFAIFTKLIKYNKIDICTKLSKKNSIFAYNTYVFMQSFENKDSDNVKNEKFNINYIFKYTYYYRNINIFIEFIKIFFERRQKNSHYVFLNNITRECCILQIIFDFFKYIKSKKSSFYQICINEIINKLLIKTYYLDNNLNYSTFFKLIGMYYVNKGKIECMPLEIHKGYRGGTWHKTEIHIKNLSNIKFKIEDYTNLEYVLYAYSYYKNCESKYIKNIDFEKIVDTTKIFDENKIKNNDYISILFMFTLVYSITYNSINIIFKFVDFLLNNPIYICFDIAIDLFFKDRNILCVNQKESNIINNNTYSNIILKVIDNEHMINDIINNIQKYKEYIKKFCNIKNNNTKIYLCIKDIIAKSNVINTIEYNCDN